MQFLTLSRRHDGSTTSPDAETVKAEVHRARTLYAEGRIRQLWHRTDGPGACVLWEAESEAEVRLMLESLPLFLAGQVEVTVVPLCPWAGFGPSAAF